MSAFLHPLMLWGLALASVPIVIHLLNRRRYQTVQWAAMDFLRAAFKKNQRRLRMENLLLLLLRTLLIILIVLALARPFVAGKVANALSSRANHYTILLDNSYSMGVNEGVSGPFDRGVREATKIVSTLSPEDSVSLYLTNDNFAGARPGSPRAVFKDSHDTEKVRSVLGRLTVSTARSELVSALAAVADQLDAKTPGRIVVVVTDFTRVSWEPRGVADSGGEETGTLLELFQEIERKGASIQMIDVGSPDAKNVAVAALGPAERRPLVEGNSDTFEARIVNYGRAPAVVDVTWLVDDELKGSTRVEVPAAKAVGDAGEAIARFAFPPIEAGPHTFAARISPTDALPVDDTQRFTAEVREKIRVLAVDGDPDGELSSETFYLKWAIAPRPDRIEVEDVDYLSFLTRDLADVDLLILANVERIREDKVREIERFVAGGKAVVLFLGNHIDPALTNQSLYKEGLGLLPAIVSDAPVLIEKDDSRVRIDLDAPPHPLLDGILGPAADPEGFWKDLSPKVWGYYRLTVPDDLEGATVLLTMTDPEKSPALVEKRFGKGTVLLFATAADRDWSDFPAPGVAIPLLHEMVYYLTREDAGRSNLLPFDTFSRELPDRVVEVQVATPGGGRTKVTPVLEEGLPPRIEFRETEAPGPYRVRYTVRGASAIGAETEETTTRFTVSVDAREGDVRPLSWLEIQARYQGVDLGYARTFSGRIEEGRSGTEGEIWKGLLAAVLFLLFAEMFLARRFGDYSRRIRREEVSQ